MVRKKKYAERFHAAGIQHFSLFFFLMDSAQWKTFAQCSQLNGLLIYSCIYFKYLYAFGAQDYAFDAQDSLHFKNGYNTTQQYTKMRVKNKIRSKQI